MILPGICNICGNVIQSIIILLDMFNIQWKRPEIRVFCIVANRSAIITVLLMNAY